MTPSTGSLLTRLGPVAMILAYVVMVYAVVANQPIWFFVAAVASYVTDAVLVESTFSTLLRRWQLGVTFRFVLREMLLVVLFVQHGGPSASAVAVLLIGLAAVHVLRLGHLYLFMRARRTRRGLLRWFNLDVDGSHDAPAPLVMPGSTWPGLAGTRLSMHFDLLLFIGVAASWRRASWPLAVTVGLVIIAGIALLRAGLAQFLRERALPSTVERNARLHATLSEYAPEIVVYFSSPISSTYALNVWLETIDRFDRRCVIFLRELGHMANLGPTRTPIVVLPTAPSVARFGLPSLRVALFPTTVIKNNHMLRLTGIRHIFINHGDGDKSVTYSPLHRAFDEVWVAGPAARARYLDNHVGVRDEQIKLVGRPQLAHITRAPGPARAPFTVLYAPTWEGNFDGVDYSSVAVMGEAIVASLLRSSMPVHVLLKPHPATGQRSPAARRARERIERMVLDAGAPHRLVDIGPESLYEAFNQSDLLVADVSSVVADYLASRKPYIVTNPKDADPDVTRAELPSTSGGYLLGSDLAGLDEMLADALGPDSLRERRRELAAYFLGPEVVDPIGHFVGLVDSAVLARPERIVDQLVDRPSQEPALPGELGPDVSTVLP